MRRIIALAVFITGIAVTGCTGSSQDQETNETPPGVVAGQEDQAMDTAGPQPDSIDPHAGHDMTSVADTPDAPGVDHSAHAAVAPGAPSRQAAAADHDAMHAPTTAASAHDATHAAHMASQRDTGHAMHAPDTTHAATEPAQSHDAHVARADTSAPDAHAAHSGTAPSVGDEQMPDMAHRMWMRPLGGDWTLMGMAQAFPIGSTSLGADDGTALDASGIYLTQPAAMFNIESPGSRVTLRTTLNFEGLTQPDGELTFGGWGEGFIDKRHPHTLLHELMLSVNLWDVAGGALSLSAGKGFAPYGTDDPMARPAVKYPTNHHLSQILERWTVNGAYVRGGWSVEAGLFGGAEPDGPYDFSNIESFGDSWSARVARRFGGGYGPMAATELSASFGRVREVHHDEELITRLYNAAVRHDRAYDFGTVYGLIEGSVSDPIGDDGYFSVLGETRLGLGAHQPYYRVELATRPEYTREGVPGTQEFFRYDHDSHAIGATRWLINTVGYGYELTGYPISARPFVEVQHNSVSAERGGIDPEDLFGRRSFWGLSAGFRVFMGGDPMRMGAYGVLDAMTAMHRSGMSAGAHGQGDAHADH